MFNYLKKIFSIFLIFNLTFVTSAQAVPTVVDAFDVSAHENVGDVTFNNDGSRMFVVGTTNDSVVEYHLTNKFDVSSASFRQTFSVNAQENNPTGLAFNNNGSKMFVIGTAGDDVNEYTLTNGFDISTASFVDAFSIAGEETFARDVSFNNDGTRMYVAGDAGNDITQYNLSTGFDVSTAVLDDFNADGSGFSVNTQEATVQGVTFNNDGTKMFVTGAVVPVSVVEYHLTTGFDVSTASFFDEISVASGTVVAPSDVTFNNDGSKMFVGDNNNDIVTEYTLTCAFKVTATSTCDAPPKIKDVRGIVDAQINTAKNFAKDSSKSILKRLAILRTKDDNKSAQNIELNFQNETLNKISDSVLSSAPAKLNPLQQILPDNWEAWTEGSVSFGEIDDNSLSSAQDMTSLGISVGADKKTDNDNVLGIALRIGNTDVDVGTFGSAVDTNALSLSVYGSNSFDDRNFLEHVIGVSHLDSDITRKNQGNTNTQTGDREGKQVFGSLNFGREYENGEATITPKGGIDGSYTALDSYTESGNEAISYNKQDIKSLMAFIGVLIDKDVNLSNSIVKSRVNLEYGKEFASNSNVVTRYTSDNVAVGYQANNKDINILTAGLGLDFKHDQGLTISTDYQRQQISGSGFMNTFSLSASFLSRNETEFALGLDEDMTSKFKISKALGVFDLGFGLENDFSSQENHNAKVSLSSKF